MGGKNEFVEESFQSQVAILSAETSAHEAVLSRSMLLRQQRFSEATIPEIYEVMSEVKTKAEHS